MAESITFNNAIYIIPDVGESNWGQNLTNYFVAIPQGCYQLSGGTSPLTADLSFGSSFGLFAKYFTSVATHPATAGVIRLASANSIEWRNNANSANLPLTTDSSDNLLWNGNIISPSSAGPVTSITGTADQIIASAATGAVTLSTPQNIDSTATPAFASETLTATTNQLVLGTTHTTTIDSVAPSASRVITVPDAGASSNMVLDQGNYTIAGAWTFSNAITITPTTNQLVLGTTRTVTISATQPASSSRTYTIPDQGAAANFVLDKSNYTIGGTWNFSNSLTLASSKAIVFTDDSTHTVTMKATNSTTSYTFSLPTTVGTSNYFLQTDGSGNTTWAAGGSGTISSGTSGRLAQYTASTTVGDSSVGNGSMDGNKITGLANGTASTDAAAFGQLKVLQTIFATTTTVTTVNSTTYTATSCTATITPTSSSNRILIIATGGLSTQAGSTADAYATLYRGTSTNLASAFGLAFADAAIAGAVQVPSTLMYVDSPATTSATTYTVYIKNDASANVGFGVSTQTQTILLMEIV